MGIDPLKSHIRDWKEMASSDPFRAISGQNKRWDVDEFFATAKPHMDQLFSVAFETGLPNRFERALEFGCGVGRFLPHFEQRFGEVWGVDVSQDMLDLAKQYNPRCKFYLNSTADLRFFSNDYFDLVYSFLVLQHLPNESVITQYIKEFVRILKPGGLAVFQIPDRLSLRWTMQPRRRVYHFLRSLGFGAERLQSWHLLPMRFTAMSEPTVRSVISAVDGSVFRTVTLAAPEAVMYYCTKSCLRL